MSKIRSAEERKRLELYIFCRIITWAVKTYLFFFVCFVFYHFLGQGKKNRTKFRRLVRITQKITLSNESDFLKKIIRSILVLQQNKRKVQWFSTYPALTHAQLPSLPSCFSRAGRLLWWVRLHCYIITTRSPRFTEGFTLDVVHSMGLKNVQ